MSEQQVTKAGRDKWDKIDILLKPLGGLFTGLALAIVGYFTTNIIEQQQATETNRRLYTEIMSSREKADSDLRKEMFNSIISAFLDPENASLDEKVLALELLAYNFHDIIDLSPLFKHVAARVEQLDIPQKQLEDKISNKSVRTYTTEEIEAYKEELTEQLKRVAAEVIDKQLASLADGGVLKRFTLDFEDIAQGSQSFDEILLPIRSDEPNSEEQRYIAVEALHSYPQSSEIKVRLESGSPDNRFAPEIDIAFKVGFFDFPLIDNSRLSHSQRIAIALTRWSDYGAELALVYFPSSRASLKEKPYYDEVIAELQNNKQKLLNSEGTR